jgi:sporulation protein YlmC with PRC-barrel domain
MDNMKKRRLQELDRSDFDVVEGEPDIRGWDVRNNAGQKIGEVEELIIDAQKSKVRYMVVDLDDNELKLEHRKVLIPIGLAQLHSDDDDVLVPNITAAHLTALPAYDPDNLDDEAEHRICDILDQQMENSVDSPGNTETTTEPKPRRRSLIIEHDENFYNHEYYRDNNLYKNRRPDSQPATTESEYERGLKLWEMRSEGGVIENEGRQRDRDMSDEKRREMVQGRRRSYEDRRGNRSERSDFRYDGQDQQRRGKTIIDRINDEGLQEAGQ